METKISKFSGEVEEGFNVLFEIVSKNLTALAAEGNLTFDDRVELTRIQGNLADTLARIVAGSEIAQAITDLAAATREQTEAMVGAGLGKEQPPEASMNCPECGRLPGTHKMDCSRF